MKSSKNTSRPVNNMSRRSVGNESWMNDRKATIALTALVIAIPLFNGFVRLTDGGGLHSPYYFVGYSTGFGARKLLGTVFSAILPHYTTHWHLVPIIWSVLLAIFLLFARFVRKVINDCEAWKKKLCTSIHTGYGGVSGFFLQHFAMFYACVVRRYLALFADVGFYTAFRKTPQ